MKLIYLALCVQTLFLLQSCGKDQMSSAPQSSSSEPVTTYNETSSISCKMKNGGHLGGCCSSHGGAKNCGNGLYQFTSSDKLICNDGTISPTCTLTN